MQCIVGTIGFEAANFVRPFIALGLREDYKVVLVRARARGEYEKLKAERAVNEVKTLIGGDHILLEYDVAPSDLLDITDKLLDYCGDAEEIIGVLAGGMRPLMFLVLSALLILHKYKGLRVKITSMREDGLSFFTLEPEYFILPDLGEREGEVLAILALHGGSLDRESLVKMLKTKWGTSHVIIYRRLKNLAKKKLIIIDGKTVKLTPLGHTLAVIVK